MVKTGWFPTGMSDEDRARQMFVAVTGLQAFKPADEIEAMLAAQAMAAHHASMECSRRAMLPDQPFEAAQGFRKAAANASRTFIELLAALDRKRGKGGQQVVRVEHVHVHRGGQAIVGNVQGRRHGGGDQARAATGDRPGRAWFHDGRSHRQTAGTGGEGGGMTTNPRQNPMRPVGNRLRHGVTGGDPRTAPRCGARTRACIPCEGPAMPNGRCRMHGGASTGPRTPEGLQRIVKARTVHGRYGAEMRELRRLMRLLDEEQRRVLELVK